MAGASLDKGNETQKCFSEAINSESVIHQVTAAAKALQLCPTLCDPIDGIDPIDEKETKLLLPNKE